MRSDSAIGRRAVEQRNAPRFRRRVAIDVETINDAEVDELIEALRDLALRWSKNVNHFRIAEVKEIDE